MATTTRRSRRNSQRNSRSHKRTHRAMPCRNHQTRASLTHPHPQPDPPPPCQHRHMMFNQPCINCGHLRNTGPCTNCGTPPKGGTYKQPGWPQQSRAIINQWVATKGLTCPGHGTPPHTVTNTSDLCLDHIQSRTDTHGYQVLCRSCNSSKG